METPASLLLAYLLGCFSSAYYLVRWRTGQDVRSLHSGNAGATNAGRVLGVWGFAVAFVGDVAKGLLALWLAAWLTDGNPWAMALAMPAVVAGHIWPVQLGWRGGEGIATGFAVVLALDPPLAGGIALLAAVLFLLTRRRAVAGAASLVALLPGALLLGRGLPELTGLALLLLIVAWAYRRHLRTLLP